MSETMDAKSEDFDRINTLKKAERVVLEAYAVSCGNTYYEPGEKVKEYLRLDSKQFHKIVNDLIDKGFLVKGYYYQKYISAQICISVVANMIMNYPDEEKFFLDMLARSRYSDEISGIDFIKAIRFVIGVDKSQRVKSLSENYLIYAINFAKNKFFPRLMLFFSSEQHVDITEQFLTGCVCQDTPCPPDVLDNLTTTVGSDKLLAANLLDLKRLYLYILDGSYDLSDSISTIRPYQQVIRGIRAANFAKYDEALAFFTAALKVLNKGQSLKNVFYLFIPSFYLIMTYARIGTEAGTTSSVSSSVKRISRSTTFSSFPWLLPMLSPIAVTSLTSIS